MPDPVQIALQAMGCRFELVLDGDSPARLRGAGEAALAEVERLHSLLTRFEPTSDVARLNAQGAAGPVRIDAELGALLAQCVELSALTHGAFDITVGGLLAGTDTDRVGSAGLLVAPDLRSASFAREGMAIDLGGTGKGYALEVVAEVLAEAGVPTAFCHAGTSSIRALGSPEIGPHWRVAIGEPPLAYRDLRDQAMAVSGRVMSGREHLLNPRTGESITGALLAAVVHPSATVADALATALAVDGERLWLHLPARFPAAEALLVAEGPGGADRIRTLGTWEVL